MVANFIARYPKLMQSWSGGQEGLRWAALDCRSFLREGHAGGELVLKIVFSGEADVHDGRECGFLACEEQHLCAAERGVAGSVNEIVREVEEADANRRVDLNVVAEGAGKMDGVERGWPLRG
jgi:hypothetical protein